MEDPGPPGRRKAPSLWQLQSDVADWQQLRAIKLLRGEEEPSESATNCSIYDNIPNYGSSDQTHSTIDNISQIENHLFVQNCDNVYQVDGNASISSYESDEEIDSEPVREVLVPAQTLAGQPFSLEVASSERVQAPSSLPLTMVANFRSAYNKKKTRRGRPR